MDRSLIVKTVNTVPAIASSGTQRSLELLRAPQHEFAVAVVENRAAFTAMREEWGALLASSRSDCLFLTWEWLHTWWKHFGQHKRLFIVTVRTGGQLVAIAPLTVTRAWVGPLARQVLEFAGTGVVGSDYLDFIVSREFEAPALEALTCFLADLGLSLRLPRVKKGPAIAIALSRGLLDRGWKCSETATEVCPFIDLSGQSWDDYLRSCSHKHRSNFRRSWRNLNNDFTVRAQWANSDATRQASLTHLVNLHLQRWNGRGGSDAFDGGKMLAFHDEVSRLTQQRRWLRLLTITLNEKPAAALYGFRYGPRFYFYQSGFDPVFSRYSVGLVTVGLSIQEAIEEGAAEYDFLHGDETYKWRWAKHISRLIHLEIYPPGRMGRLHRNAARAVAAAKKLAVHVRQKKA